MGTGVIGKRSYHNPSIKSTQYQVFHITLMLLNLCKTPTVMIYANQLTYNSPLLITF